MRRLSDVDAEARRAIYIPILRGQEEVQYAEDLKTLLSWLLDPFIPPKFGELSSVSMNNFFLSWSLEKVWFIYNHIYWVRDQELEVRVRSRPSLSLVFADWKNVEVHAIPSWRRPNYHASFPKL